MKKSWALSPIIASGPWGLGTPTLGLGEGHSLQAQALLIWAQLHTLHCAQCDLAQQCGCFHSLDVSSQFPTFDFWGPSFSLIKFRSFRRSKSSRVRTFSSSCLISYSLPHIVAAFAAHQASAQDLKAKPCWGRAPAACWPHSHPLSIYPVTLPLPSSPLTDLCP